MKDIKTKIKSVGLILAMVLYANIGFTQEEPIGSTTEEIVTNIVDESQSPEASECVQENEAVTSINISVELARNYAEKASIYAELADNYAQIAGNHAELAQINAQCAIVINSLEETILFQFLQDNAFLRELATILYNSSTVPAELLDPLSEQLHAKLLELAENESFPVNDLDLRAADEEDAWSDFIEHYPNLSDLFSLTADSEFKDRFWKNALHFDEEIKRLKESTNTIMKDNANLSAEVLWLIYNDTLSNYLEFIKQNEKILEKIRTIVNNNFQIESDHENKKCIKFRNRDYCSVPATKPIESLRELMAHVLKN